MASVMDDVFTIALMIAYRLFNAHAAGTPAGKTWQVRGKLFATCAIEVVSVWNTASYVTLTCALVVDSELAIRLQNIIMAVAALKMFEFRFFFVPQ